MVNSTLTAISFLSQGLASYQLLFQCKGGVAQCEIVVTDSKQLPTAQCDIYLVSYYLFSHNNDKVVTKLHNTKQILYNKTRKLRVIQI